MSIFFYQGFKLQPVIVSYKAIIVQNEEKGKVSQSEARE